jgi:hypothetical protein
MVKYDLWYKWKHLSSRTESWSNHNRRRDIISTRRWGPDHLDVAYQCDSTDPVFRHMLLTVSTRVSSSTQSAWYPSLGKRWASRRTRTPIWFLLLMYYRKSMWISHNTCHISLKIYYSEVDLTFPFQHWENSVCTLYLVKGSPYQGNNLNIVVSGYLPSREQVWSRGL